MAKSKDVLNADRPYLDRDQCIKDMVDYLNDSSLTADYEFLTDAQALERIVALIGDDALTAAVPYYTDLDALALACAAALNSTAMPIGYEELWETPFSVNGDAASGYSTNYNPLADKPSGTTHWVATTGSDSTGDGSEALPWRTIQKAITEGANVVNIKTGFYEDDDAAFNVAVSRDMAFVAVDGKGTVIWSSNQDNLTWTQEAGPNDSVYSATLANTVNDVVDLTHTISGKTLIDGSTGLPDPYTEQASIADCQANAGSFYYTGTTLYVHTHDSREPDSDVKPLWNVDIWSTGMTLNHTLYLEGIEFWGDRCGYFTGTTSASNNTLLVINNCAFRYDSDVCLRVGDMNNFRIVNPTVSHSGGDAISSFNNTQNFWEQGLIVNPQVEYCNRNQLANGNCLTGHNQDVVIVVGGNLVGNGYGRPCHYVNGAQVVLYGTESDYAGSGEANFTVGGANATSGEFSRMYLFGCTSGANADYDREKNASGLLFSDSDFTGGVGTDYKHSALDYDTEHHTWFRYGHNHCHYYFDFTDDGADNMSLSGGKIVSVNNKGGGENRIRENTDGNRFPAPAVVEGKAAGQKLITSTSRHTQNRFSFEAAPTIGTIIFVVDFLSTDGVTTDVFENYETILSGTGVSAKERIMANVATPDFLAGGNDFADGAVINDGDTETTEVLPMTDLTVLHFASDDGSAVVDASTHMLFSNATSGSRGFTGNKMLVWVSEDVLTPADTLAYRQEMMRMIAGTN